jgi:hypothetical protein
MKLRVPDRYPLTILTPWSGVLPEKLIDPQLVNKFPAFYGNRKFIIVFTRARHLPLSKHGPIVFLEDSF